MTYIIKYHPRIAKDLRGIPKEIVERLEKAVSDIGAAPFEPRNKMVGRANYYRVKVGVYRIVYEATPGIPFIIITRIGHRKDVYRGL